MCVHLRMLEQVMTDSTQKDKKHQKHRNFARVLVIKRLSNLSNNIMQMYAIVLALAVIAVAFADYNCPASKSPVHAGCKVNINFSNECSTVQQVRVVLLGAMGYLCGMCA